MQKNDVLVDPFKNWNEKSKLLKKQMDYTLGRGKSMEQKHYIEAIGKEYFIISPSDAKVQV